MSKKQLLQNLEDLATQLDVKIRYEKTTAKGGLCKHNGKFQIIVDKKATDELKMTIIATALKTFDLSKVFVSPKLREFMEV